MDTDHADPMNQYILSHDALRNTTIDQTISPNSGWSNRPIKRISVRNIGTWSRWREGDAGAVSSAEREELLELLKKGVPPALRCAIWVTNVIRVVQPGLTKEEIDEYGTLAKVRILEHGWKVALKSLFPDESDEADAIMPNLGLGHMNLSNLLLRDHGGEPIPKTGADALKRVLYAAHQSLGVDYCPLLPDLAAIMLTAMEESYAYATIREMLEEDNSYSHFLALTRVEHIAWCKTWVDLMYKLYPQTAEALQEIGVLTPNGLDPILKRFCVTLLPYKHVLRLMDIFTLDGIEVLFRFTTALSCLYHAHMTTHELLHCDCPTAWWDGVRRFAHSSHFRFDSFILTQVYSVSQGRFSRRDPFPRKDYLDRIIADNEDWARDNLAQHNPEAHEETPLGFVEGSVPIVLAKHASERQRLAEWMPLSCKSTKLDLIYSTNVHGRTVERFYSHCAVAKHTITLIEVLGRTDDIVLGMFATQTWHRNRWEYGDGECFLFRLKPNPVCFKWNAQGKGGLTTVLSSSSSIDEESGSPSVTGSKSFDSADGQKGDGDEISTTTSKDDASLKERAAQIDPDQVMVSGKDFISMGVGRDGASGLRLNEDLTRGTTSPAMGFGHMSLLGEDTSGGKDSVFEVGLVEVYQLVREVDGKPVDHP